MNLFKLLLALLWSFLAVACISKNTNTAQKIKNTDKVLITDTLSKDRNLQLDTLALAGLETFVQSTSYSALITNINIKTESQDAEYLHIITAEVVELFRGKSTKSFIKFEAYTEPGEYITFEKQALICLCQKGDQLFWAGTGSVFLATKLFITKARETAEKIKDSTADFCD